MRYIPASDVSVIGNRLWVAPNQPCGVILVFTRRQCGALDLAPSRAKLYCPP